MLAGMGIPHAVEARVSCPDHGDAVVDILIEAPGGARIAVEVDGPHHYTALPPHRNLGHTALRNRLLEARCGLAGSGTACLPCPPRLIAWWHLLLQGAPDRASAIPRRPHQF